MLRPVGPVQVASIASSIYSNSVRCSPAGSRRGRLTGKSRGLAVCREAGFGDREIVESVRSDAASHPEHTSSPTRAELRRSERSGVFDPRRWGHDTRTV